MTYTIIAGLVAGIFLLLWRLEASRHARTKDTLGARERQIVQLNEILVLERKLNGEVLSAADKEAVEKRIRDVEKAMKEAKPGEEIRDVFGTGKADEGKSPT